MARLIICIDVDDLDRAERFYTAALGLRVGRRFGQHQGLELLGGEAPIDLLVAPPGTPPFAGAQAARAYGRHWTPVHLDFEVDDLEGAVRRAEEAGARVEVPIKKKKWGRIAVLADPFGHGFCLLQFQGRGYDEVAVGEG